MQRRLRLLLRQLCLVAATAIVCLSLLEFAFRYYLFPFYTTEFTWENSPREPEGGILIVGDSYTALHQSFAFQLRDSLAESVHILGVPGIGIREVLTFLPSKLEEFKPAEVWYQVYLGNDFLDIRHPLNWDRLSFTRNCYWWLSDKVLSLRYLNYKLGGLGHEEQGSDIKSLPTFSPELYNLREKRFFVADPDWLMDLNQARGDIWNSVLAWESCIHDLQQVCSNSGVVLKVVIIPHPAQVGALSDQDVVSLGGTPGTYSDSQRIQDSLFTFLNRNQIPYIDLFSPLSQIDTGSAQPVYFPNDPHLTVPGNEIVTNALLEWHRQGTVLKPKSNQ